MKSRISLLLGVCLLLPLTGCNLRQVLGWDMYNQPKAGKPYRESEFFEDRSSARQLVKGTVPRGVVKLTEAGKKDGFTIDRRFFDRNQEPVSYERAMYAGADFPEDIRKDLDGEKLKETLERGQVVFNIYCAVCHGQTGRGDGMIVQRGFSKPPSFVVPLESDPDREKMEKGDPYRWQRTQFLQTAPPRHVYDVISHGFGGMYSYGERVKPDDRWKVAAYIKTLQVTPAEPRPAPKVAGPTSHPAPGHPPG